MIFRIRWYFPSTSLDFWWDLDSLSSQYKLMSFSIPRTTLSSLMNFLPNNFRCSINCYNVHNFYCRICNSASFPAYFSFIEINHETRIRSKVIFLALEARIHVTYNNQLILSTISQRIILSSSQSCFWTFLIFKYKLNLPNFWNMGPWAFAPPAPGQIRLWFFEST